MASRNQLFQRLDRRAGQTMGGKLRAPLTCGSMMAGRVESDASPQVSIAALDLARRCCLPAQHHLPRFVPLSSERSPAPKS
jgi:hypothetical protein